MIITCPDCTTRYDVDDERFSPNGRSVRCSSCGESWFVPAPELIDVEPIKENDTRAEKEKAVNDRIERPSRRENSDRARIRVGVPKDDADHQDRDDDRKDRNDIKNHQERDRNRRDDSNDDRDYEDRDRKDRKSRRDRRDDEQRRKSYDDDEDDSLFVRSKDRVENKPKGRDHDDDNANMRSRNDRDDSRRSHRDRDEDDDVQEKGWRKGRQFIIEDEDDVENRPFFARKKKKERDDDRREPLRFGDDDYADERGKNDTREEERFSDDDIDFDVVDADWEDVGEDGPIERGFGRRIRNQRRRATALARLEDVRPLDPQALDDEFFAALKVTPRELETAIRKARRRAEARDKNRLTPLRAFGWAMWLFAVVGVLYVVVTYRDDIVKIAPGTADAYAVIGIDANPYGLAIDNVRHRLAMSTGGPTIEITGHLRNETGAAIDAPLLQAEALGARGELLARWTFAASDAQVSESGIVEFVTRAPAPDGVTEVALSFAPASSTVLDSLLPLNE